MAEANLTGAALLAALKKINPGGTVESQAIAKAGGVWVTPEEKAALDKAHDAAITNNPYTGSHVAAGNTPESLRIAAETGDLSGIVDAQGQPFSLADQQAALAQATEDNRLFYEAQKQKDTQDAEAALKQKQLDYQKYLADSQTKFESDKATLDQNAADKGVLFSGGRAQKEKALGSQYAQDQAYKQSTVGADIGQTARDYQYKYGNESANNLSDYYRLGSNQYNPSVATGGVTSGGLSSVYSTGGSNFQGTKNVERQATAQTRAANLLANKANKLTGSLYKL